MELVKHIELSDVIPWLGRDGICTIWELDCFRLRESHERTF